MDCDAIGDAAINVFAFYHTIVTTCGAERRAGKWLQLADLRCEMARESRTTAYMQQQPLLEALLAQQQETLDRPAAKREDVKLKHQAEEAAAPVATIEENTTWRLETSSDYRKVRKAPARLGYSRAEG